MTIGSTFRTVYTVKFEGEVYILDAFQKKSVKGIKTPLVDINRIRSRLKEAREIYNERKRKKESEEGGTSRPPSET